MGGERERVKKGYHVGLCWTFPFSKCKRFSVSFSSHCLPTFQWTATTKKLHRVSDWFCNEIFTLAWSCGSHFLGHKPRYRTQDLKRTHMNSGGSLSNRTLLPVLRWQVTWGDWLLQDKHSDLQTQLLGIFLGMWEKKKKMECLVVVFSPNRDSLVISLLIITKKKPLKWKKN